MITRDGESFNHGGRLFRLDIVADDSGETPWSDDECLSGVVSEWLTPDDWKAADDQGLIALATNSNSRTPYRRYFDRALAITNLIQIGGCDPVSAAGQADQLIGRCRAWLNDDWRYVGVVVTLGDSMGRLSPEREAAYGFESDDAEGISTGAEGLADEILARLRDCKWDSEKLALRMHWSAETIALHLRAFIDDRGLTCELESYLRMVANEESLDGAANGR